MLAINCACLNNIVPLDPSHLRRSVSEFVAHYHLERNHQRLDNALIASPSLPKATPPSNVADDLVAC